MTFHSKDHYIKSFPSFEWNKQQSKGLMPVGMWCRGLLDPDSYPYMTRHLILCLRLINNYTHPIQNFQAKYPNTLVKKLNSLLLGLALSGFFLWIVKCLKATARKKRYNLFSPVYHCHIDQTVNWKPENSDPATSFFSWGLRLRGQRSEFPGPEVSWHPPCSQWSLIRTRKKQATKQIEDESRCNVKSGRNKR